MVVLKKVERLRGGNKRRFDHFLGDMVSKDMVSKEALGTIFGEVRIKNPAF